MKKTLLALSVASLLTACGGSSDGDTSTINSSTPNSSTQYRVIDGYLSNADVCLIKENETACTSIGLTDENGLITLPEGTVSGQLVATIIAGQTTDADSVGFVGQTYQMIADINEDSAFVITPYTTLDVLDETKTIDDIAADLDLDVDLIKGDYVTSNNANKDKAHALARALVTQLSEDQKENKVSELLTKAIAIKQYIDDNVGVDLNEQNIIFLDDDSISTIKAIKKLDDFLVNKDGLIMFSLNPAYYSEEGELTVLFNKDGTGTIDSDYDSQKMFSYKIKGNTLTSKINNESATDEFIYVNETFALSVPVADKDLNIITTSNKNEEIESWDRESLIGHTYYLIFDDASTSEKNADPSLMTIIFSDEIVKITENGESKEFGWNVNSEGYVKLLTGNNFGDRDVTISKKMSDGVITVYKDYYNDSFGLILSDKNLAHSIYKKWSTITK